MTVWLEDEVTIGEVTVAALVKSGVTSHLYDNNMIITGHKSPVAILFRSDGFQATIKPDGTRLAPEDIENLCIGAWQTFTRTT